jgi:predicted Zn-ribbon and HTH transcriptional regulator
MKCELCGFEFDERTLVCHVRCPMAAGCAIICCPNCGYQAVDARQSQAAHWLERMRAALARRPKQEAKA